MKSVGIATVDVKVTDIFNETGLLACLIAQNDIHEAPENTARYGGWSEVLIGIGKDHVAYITLPNDALEELVKITGNETCIAGNK